METTSAGGAPCVENEKESRGAGAKKEGGGGWEEAERARKSTLVLEAFSESAYFLRFDLRGLGEPVSS